VANNVSPERSLAGTVVISVLIAAIASQSDLLEFGSFVTMASILIAGNLVTYALMKAGLFKSRRD
jgi:hypothetical protein